MNNIKISIIIPIYNTSKFLEKCIRSIMEQNFKEIEIICVNDGSKDNSLEILNKLAKEDSRIMVIDKKNEGVSKARNVALEKAQGKYCLNVDSDDWIEQGYLKALYERAEKDNLDITISNIIFDYLDNSKKNYILNDLNISEEKIINKDEYINVFLKNNFHGYTWNKLIKTELYKNNKLKYNEEISMLEDVEIILKIVKFSKKIGKVNKAFYHYIQHDASCCQNISLKKVKDVNKCFKILLKCFSSDKKICFKLKNKMCVFLIYFLKQSFNLKNNLEYQEIQKEILKENRNLSFLKFEHGKAKVDIIYGNILKIFPYIKIMNLLFMFDIKIIEKLRRIKN